ncbi:hypothetical protein ASD24_06650 [Paenibacillus sp. Root52]|uniref:hypothetical protein n=1 Tax=Paenibacillus sp. Root52 TaxID=1736552 RepID=UPI0007014FAA|nr:hypothetical protein [Paenibacillus sp. Root52]KQY87526.1 hypothetical protein ASD24_06650 [Paenibacillus sp. Root52]
MKQVYLLFLLLIMLSACTNVNEDNEELVRPVTDVQQEVINPENQTTAITENTPNTPSTFVALGPNSLSVRDFESAYAMCVSALTAYYKATWNGSEFDVNTYLDNDNLKQYMQAKIDSQHELFLQNNLTDNTVTGLKAGVEKAEFHDEGDFFYLKIDAEVIKDVGSYAEPTEFIIQNSRGNLVIMDWYTSGKDSYDSMIRGEDQVIDNPDIWKDGEWVEGSPIRP